MFVFFIQVCQGVPHQRYNKNKLPIMAKNVTLFPRFSFGIHGVSSSAS